MAPITRLSWTPSHEQAEAELANIALKRLAADDIKDDGEDTPSARQSIAVFGATRDELLRDYEFNFAQRRLSIPEDSTYANKGPWSYAYKLEPTTGSYASIGTTTNQTGLTGFSGLAVNSLRGYKVAGSGIPAGAYIMSNTETTATMNAKATATASVTITLSLAVLKVLEIGNVKENMFEVIGEGTNRRLLCNVAGSGSPSQLPIKYVEQVLDPLSWDSLFRDAVALRLASKMAIPLVKRADLAQFLQGEFAAIFNLAKVASSKERQVDEAEPQWTDRGQPRQRQ
jgi:hypothetical protein